MLDQIWRDRPIRWTAGFVWNATKVVSSAWNKKKNRLLAAVTMRAHQITPSQKVFPLMWAKGTIADLSQLSRSALGVLAPASRKDLPHHEKLEILPQSCFLFFTNTSDTEKKGCSTHYCLFSARLGGTFINSGMGLPADLGVCFCLIPIIDEPTSRTPINKG